MPSVILIMAITTLTTTLICIKRMKAALSRTVCNCSPKNQLHIVLTGSTSGIGKSSLNRLLPHSKVLSLISRDMKKANTLKAEFSKKYPNAVIDIHYGDLSDFKSISNLDQEFSDKMPIDVLINNAGIISYKNSSPFEGLDMNATVNYLGTVKLTETLKKHLNSTSDRKPRIIFVSSSLSSRSTAMDSSINKFFLLPQWSPMLSYGVSKHALNIYAKHLSELKEKKTDIYIVVTGGVVKTELNREIRENSNIIKRYLMQFVSSLFFLRPEIGCQSMVHCALSDNVYNSHLDGDVMRPSSILYRDCKPERLYDNVGNSFYRELLQSTFDVINSE